MKKRNIIIGMLAISAMLVIVACTKNTTDTSEDIQGIYHGSFNKTANLESPGSSGTLASPENGYAEVSVLLDHQIKVHCVGDEIDTTFILDYYMHNDSIMVCMTGDGFEHMYGHAPGMGHMNGNMMEHMDHNETEWMHHLNDEHEMGDPHFGGFDMQNGTFSYSMHMMGKSGPYYMHFTGSKK